MPLVLGVDSAATATTAEFRDADTGQVFASGTARHPAEPGADDDPRVWWQGLVDARGQAGGALTVAAMAVAAPPSGLVLLDESQKVLRPAIRARAADRDVAGLLEALGGGSEWVVAVGSVPGAADADRTARVAAPHRAHGLGSDRHACSPRPAGSPTG